MQNLRKIKPILWNAAPTVLFSVGAWNHLKENFLSANQLYERSSLNFYQMRDSLSLTGYRLIYLTTALACPIIYAIQKRFKHAVSEEMVTKIKILCLALQPITMMVEWLALKYLPMRPQHKEIYKLIENENDKFKLNCNKTQENEAKTMFNCHIQVVGGAMITTVILELIPPLCKWVFTKKYA